MGTYCCSDRIDHIEDIPNNETINYDLIKIEANRNALSYTGKLENQNFKITLNKPKKKYGELLNTSSEYWKMRNNIRIDNYELQMQLIFKNNFVFTVREYFAAKKIFKFLKRVKRNELLKKRKTV